MRAVRALCVIVALVLTGAVISPWLDVLAGNYVPMLQALIVVSLGAAMLCFLGAMVTRRRFFIGVFALPVMAALPAVGLLSTHPHAPHINGQRHLRVFSLNCEYGQVDVASAMQAISQVKPDVIIFVEMNPHKLALLDSAGLAREYRYRSTDLMDDGARGSVILAKYPMTTTDPGLPQGPFDLQWPIANVQAPGEAITVRAIHTYPPLHDGVAVWRPQLQAIGRWQKSTSGPLVMGGDFNASVAHPAFRAMTHGLSDTYPAVHGAWMPTWPHGSLMPPFTQIDHVLTRDFAPEEAGVLTVKGTDHAAIWAQLRY